MHACTARRRMHAHATGACVAIMTRLASLTSSARRSTKPSQQPLSLAEEQAAFALCLLEQRDVAAALRLSLQGRGRPCSC